MRIVGVIDVKPERDDLLIDERVRCSIGTNSSGVCVPRRKTPHHRHVSSGEAGVQRLS